MTSDPDTGSSSTTDPTDTADSSSDTGTADVTIYDIQNGTIGLDVDVDVQDVVVTAIATSGFFIEEPAGGEYSGIFVFAGFGAPVLDEVTRGDEVNVTGITTEFQDITEIDVTAGTVTPTGVTGIELVPDVIDALTIGSDVSGEPWESVLVRLPGPLPVTALLGNAEFEVTDVGSNPAIIDNYLYSTIDDPGTFANFGVGAGFTGIDGVLNYNAGSFKLAPREAADLAGYTEGPAEGLSVEDLVAGDLIVTEIMYDPSCPSDTCEWIEVFNASGEEVNLNGLILDDEGGNQGTIAGATLVAADSYVVLASHTPPQWPFVSVTPAAHYGSQPAWNNGGDTVMLRNSTILIDQSAAWPSNITGGGVSLQLDAASVDATANDDLANWCPSATVFEAAEVGTPAAANGNCG